MNKQYDCMDADNIVHEESYVKACSRKRRRESDLVNNVEPNKEVARPNGSRKNCLDLPDDALGLGCLADTLKVEVVADTSLKIGNDSLLENPSGGFSDTEHEFMKSKNNIEMVKSKDTRNEDISAKYVSVADPAGENDEYVERAKLNANRNVACDVYSTQATIKESTISCEENKASGDACAQIEILDQKKPSKMKNVIDPLLELDASKGNVTQVVNKEDLPPQILHASLGSARLDHSKEKLLVLDVNGLLTDIVPDSRDVYKFDTIIGSKAVFKRPFCDDFLQFCFERFKVGVWSSRTKRNVQRVLDFIMGKHGHNLLFCWDQSHCTDTGYNTIENRDKPLVLKELRKLWEKQDPDLPWNKGDFDESNTLLLDDSPYKALRNPPNTAIFPHTWHYRNKNDKSLGPGGDLRVYLERLASAENVQKFIEQHPFGQRPITKTNLSWRFYLKVMGATSSQLEAEPSPHLESDPSSHMEAEHSHGREADPSSHLEAETSPHREDDSSSHLEVATISSSAIEPPLEVGDNTSSLG